MTLAQGWYEDSPDPYSRHGLARRSAALGLLQCSHQDDLTTERTDRHDVTNTSSRAIAQIICATFIMVLLAIVVLSDRHDARSTSSRAIAQTKPANSLATAVAALHAGLPRPISRCIRL